MKLLLFIATVILGSASEQLSNSDNYYTNPAVDNLAQSSQTNAVVPKQALPSLGVWHASNPTGLSKTYSYNPFLTTYKSIPGIYNVPITTHHVSSTGVYPSPVEHHGSVTGTNISPVAQQNSSPVPHSVPVTTYVSSSQAYPLVAQYVSPSEAYSPPVNSHVSSTETYSPSVTQHGSFLNTYPVPVTTYVTSFGTHSPPGAQYKSSSEKYSVPLTTYVSSTEAYPSPTTVQGSTLASYSDSNTIYSSSVKTPDISKLAKPVSTTNSYYGTYSLPVTSLSGTNIAPASTSATPTNYPSTYLTPKASTSYHSLNTTPATPTYSTYAPTTSTYYSTTPDTFTSYSTEYSTPIITTTIAPVSYNRDSKPVDSHNSFPSSHSNIVTIHGSSAGVITPVIPQQSSSVLLAKPDTTHNSTVTSFSEPNTVYDTSSATHEISSKTYSVKTPGFSIGTYSKPVHSLPSGEYSIPLKSLDLTHVYSTPITTHVVSGYSTPRTPISNNPVFSTPVPISYKSVYIPLSYSTPATAHLSYPSAYSAYLPSDSVDTVVVSPHESSLFNVPSSSHFTNHASSSSLMQNLHKPPAYTVIKVPLIGEYHTVQKPFHRSWKTIDTWNVDQKLLKQSPREHF